MKYKIIVVMIITCFISGCGDKLFNDKCNQADLFKKCVSEMSQYNELIINDCEDLSRHSSYIPIDQITKTCP